MYITTENYKKMTLQYLEQEKKELVIKYNRTKTKDNRYKLSKALNQIEAAIMRLKQ